MTHLTEEERQSAADGTLDARRQAAVQEHLAACDECSADVARLRTLLARARAAPDAPGDAADQWPAIRERIERGKIVPLPGAATPRRGADWRQFGIAVAAAAAMVTIFVVSRPRANAPSGVAATPDTAVITAVTDSTTAYREQIADLMSDLELRRGLLRTETSTAIDRDLKECDAAIAELDSAIKADPANPALRQMLAASYRRKLDVLRRVGNAS
jgi:anti-sigma factor RsiW